MNKIIAAVFAAPFLLSSVAFADELPPIIEWQRDGQEYRCKDGKVQGCIAGWNCKTAGRPEGAGIAVCQRCEMWVDLDEYLGENPAFRNFLQITPEAFGPDRDKSMDERR